MDYHIWLFSWIMHGKFDGDPAHVYLKDHATGFVSECFPFFKDQAEDESQDLLFDTRVPDESSSLESKLLFILERVDKKFGSPGIVTKVDVRLFPRLYIYLNYLWLSSKVH